VTSFKGFTDLRFELEGARLWVGGRVCKSAL